MDLSSAVWIDVNTKVGLNNYPDRLPDELGIQLSSLYNLLRCPIGARGRTFQPTYGTILYHLLQEPLNNRSAGKIQIGLIQAIERWEPRIAMDRSQTTVIPVYDLPGYKLRLVFSLRLDPDTLYAVEYDLARRS